MGVVLVERNNANIGVGGIIHQFLLRDRREENDAVADSGRAGRGRKLLLVFKTNQDEADGGGEFGHGGDDIEDPFDDTDAAL